MPWYRALVRFFAGVHTHVDEQFISGIEWSTLATAVGPLTDVLVADRRRTRCSGAALIDVLLDVLNELILREEQLSTVQPQADERHVAAAVLGRGRP